MEQLRNDSQATVVDLYTELDPLRAALVLSTGFGKSKVAIEILKHKRPEKILILVNSTILRDFSWTEEFTKFGEAEMFQNNVEIVTYQLAYKWRPQTKDLNGYFVIADEVDFAANTDELSKFFYAYPEVQMMGLTGFITDDKKEWFTQNLPVITELSADDAQESGLLNNIHYIFVKYDLSNNPNDILVEYMQGREKKRFYQSENNAFDYANKKVHVLESDKDKVNLMFMKGEITAMEQTSKTKNLEYQIGVAVAARNDILLTSKASRLVAQKLIEYTHAKNPDSKVIVFSKRTKQSLEICGAGNTYTGAIPKVAADLNFTNFLNGTIKVLGVCDKVNRGANIDGLDVAIFETFYGSDTEATQRFGRLMRLKPDTVATAYILLPYYMRKEANKRFTVQETQQVKWAKKMLRSTNVKLYDVWDYRTVKENTDE